MICNLGCVQFKKIQDWILKSERNRKRICVSLLDRSIHQDLWDYGASKEPKKSTSKENSSVPLTHHDPKDLRSICLGKETQNPSSNSFGCKNPMLDFLKEIHPQKDCLQENRQQRGLRGIMILILNTVALYFNLYTLNLYLSSFNNVI